MFAKLSKATTFIIYYKNWMLLNAQNCNIYSFHNTYNNKMCHLLEWCKLAFLEWIKLASLKLHYHKRYKNFFRMLLWNSITLKGTNKSLLNVVLSYWHTYIFCYELKEFPYFSCVWYQSHITFSSPLISILGLLSWLVALWFTVATIHGSSVLITSEH